MSQPPSEWLAFDDVVFALQSSVRRADDRISRESGGMHYVVTELTVSFPAEVRVDDPSRTWVRLPAHVRPDDPRVPDTHLSRLSVSLRPVPALEQPVAAPS
jgi:hypothetical protein